MSSDTKTGRIKFTESVIVERTFPRFTFNQRWEHMLVFASALVLLLTGLPQKYRSAAWSQQILSTPERLEIVRQLHHIAALVLMAVVLYHLLHGIYLLIRRELPGDIFPQKEDFGDAWKMIKYLLFLSKSKPLFWKYNFEQKFTYWFIFLTIGAMVITGLIIWFPIQVTRILPGAVIPAAKLAHSTEALVLTIFVLIWHVYHVHIERLNLSIFTGRLSEKEMREYHTLEYERLMEDIEEEAEPDAQQP